jgi:hypothetical protein
MRKSGFAGALMLAAVVLAGAGIARAADSVTVKLGAVPKVTTSAGGEARFTLAGDGSSIHYELILKSASNVTMAHVHEVAGGGLPGAVAVWLYPAGEEQASLREGTFNGTLVTGDIGAGKLRGPAKGGTVKALFEQLASGKAGVAVHTKGNPGGELWGIASAGKEMKEMKMEGGGIGY